MSRFMSPLVTFSNCQKSIFQVQGSLRVGPTLAVGAEPGRALSLIHISEPTRLGMISYAVFCLKIIELILNQPVGKASVGAQACLYSPPLQCSWKSQQVNVRQTSRCHRFRARQENRVDFWLVVLCFWLLSISRSVDTS